MPRVPKPRPAREREVVVREAAPAVHVHATRHSWITLAAADGGLVVREESGAPESVFTVAPGRYTVRTDGRLGDVRAEAPPDAAVPGDEAGTGLRLSSDAPDDSVDGVGEVPADGASSCTITVEKLGADGEPLHGRSHDDELLLRTTGGTLVDDHGDRVRAARLRSGRMTVRLVSESTPRVVTVEAVAAAPLGRAELRIEFV